MATTTGITGRIDRSLHAILAEVQDLPSRADKWDSLPEWERASISLEWDHLMADYLTELDEAYRTGRMAPPQERRYRNLLRQLEAVLPIIERLNFYRPPVSLDA